MTDRTLLSWQWRILRLGALLLMVALAGCGPRLAQPEGTPFDPFEEENRKMHAFNKSLDQAVLRPVSLGYTKAVPDDIERMVERFSFNASMPGAILNNILQGNMKAATEDLYRFTVNSTIGLAGLFDPATELRMPAASDTDFGQTLHVWGVPAGAYIELPAFGPSTERDTMGRFVDFVLDPLDLALPRGGRRALSGAWLARKAGERGRFTGTIDALLYESTDSYRQSRSLYLQNRAFELGEANDSTTLDPYDDPYLQ